MLKNAFLKNKIFRIGQVIVLLVGVLLFYGILYSRPSRAYIPDQQQGGETLIAHFADGSYAVTSQQEYLGLVTITISDIGQASGTQYSDAFYLLTDYKGNPIDPIHPTLLYNWVLWINGQHAEDFIPGQQVPSYRGDHTYTFEINAPGGNLVFGIGDAYTADNTGSYTIHINTSSSGSVPFFSQRDPRWMNHPLRTNGICSSYCNTIGACGCTLTAAAMLFAYYGANLTPPTLSDCMGTSACPFYWSVGASCSNGQASWVNRYAFSWARLDQELNQNGRPVILGMHRGNNIYDTHWVLVTNGHGSNASDYLIHDPWPLDGADTNLNIYTRQNYVFDWISVYDGQSAFNLGYRDTNHQYTSPPQTMRTDEYPAGVTTVPYTAIIPTPTPIATGSTKLSSVTPVSNTIIATSSTISGSIFVYHLSETAVTVQLAATSTVNDVTEMQVWTDSNPTSAWQTFASFAWLPWMPEDKVYARFRDGFGNISSVYSDTLYPVYSPPPDPQIFLPIILESQ